MINNLEKKSLAIFRILQFCLSSKNALDCFCMYVYFSLLNRDNQAIKTKSRFIYTQTSSRGAIVVTFYIGGMGSILWMLSQIIRESVYRKYGQQGQM
jgi:hypothetical protein